LKDRNVTTEEEATQPTDENEEKEESRSSENPQTAENSVLGKIKIEFYKALK
jgi:transposase-like protein